jgi:hypothetical protein
LYSVLVASKLIDASKMVFAAATVLQLVLQLLWACLRSTPVRKKHPLYDTVVPTQVIAEQLFSSLSLVFAPGLDRVIQASTPPTLSWFKSLPTDRTKRWAVYVSVLESQAAPLRPKIYIGSGTDAHSGVSARLAMYDNEVQLPRHVAKALNDGYSITHKGILCWIPIPSPANVPLHRVFIMLLEATFTFVFWGPALQ